jgi:phospholipid/cholesterol/gamma-HCH transport system substrate-binding protein
MEPEAKYTIVGTVVLVLLALLVGAVLWLRTSGAGPQANEYRIEFRHQSLEGLARRSAVTMRGIRVGAVTGYRFSAANASAVDVFIALEPGTPVFEGTRAAVERNLVTGLATVQLVNPDGRSRPLRPAAAGGAPPVIAEGVAPGQEIAASVTELALRLNQTLSPENRAALSDTLTNLRRISGHADQTLVKLDRALDALGGTTRRVSGMADSFQTSARTLGARYDQLGAQADRILGDADVALRQASAGMDQLTRHTDSWLLTSDQDLQATTQSLRAAAQSIQIAADRLREPSEILYGPRPEKLGPGEAAR